MIVLPRNLKAQTCPPSVARFISPTQLFITAAVSYEVHAMVVFQGITFVQIVDDLGSPKWLPTWLFDTIDSSVPDDWIVNLFHNDGPDVIIGPAFIANHEESYNAMVELESTMVERFWQRIESRAGGEAGR